ncbi:ATP-binding cassette domain-containing protein [Ruminococcus albus]|uniref:ATP-binding cassette domain-containing protein n=1 Tax=Ruminococcus albus TaxID=1264 RepID=UPI00223918C2|nr:ATP-binding cassette domain-containing protein [Ruminococcus albus]
MPYRSLRGCGKSTLVSLLLGLQFPTKGEILINDKPVTGPDVNRGWCFSTIHCSRGLPQKEYHVRIRKQVY